VESIFLWYVIKHQQTGKWGGSTMPPEKDGQSMGKARSRALILVERLLNADVRQTGYGMLDMGPKVLTADDFGDALIKHDQYSEACVSVNKALGRLIRESWPN
jgi:hypothetical protein